MTIVAVAAVLAPLGVAGFLVAVRRVRRPLGEVLGGLERELVAPVASVGASERGPGVRRRRWRPDRSAGDALAARIQATTVAARLDADLFVLGKSLAELCAQCVLAASAGLLLPALCGGLAALGGVRFPVAIPVAVAVALGVAGGALPVLGLRVEAGRERRTSARALGSVLDLVVLGLAGGMGLEGALHAATGVGDHRLSRRLSSSLAVAHEAGQPLWAVLDELGRRCALAELVELAAALRLAGQEGARIRGTLAAKAASVRKRELARAEAEANRTTERLFLPGILLMLGFLVFIGYPAVARIVTGL